MAGDVPLLRTLLLSPYQNGYTSTTLLQPDQPLSTSAPTPASKHQNTRISILRSEPRLGEQIVWVACFTTDVVKATVVLVFLLAAKNDGFSCSFLDVTWAIFTCSF
jgi:hypothetical protein